MFNSAFSRRLALRLRSATVAATLASLTWVGALSLGGLEPRAARADVGREYGFGSRAAALGGTTAAWSPDAFAAASNPAMLGGRGESRFRLSYGYLWMHPSFTPIENVVVENNWASDKSPPRFGDVEHDYKDTLGQVLAADYRFEGALGFGLGLVTYLPLNQTALIDTGEVYIPEYVLYRARTQQPQLELGAGLSAGDSVRLGFGLHTRFAVTTRAKVFLQTDSSRPSYMRLSASAKPKLSPFLGVQVGPGVGRVETPPAAAPVAGLAEVAPPWSLGAVLRFPNSPRYESRIESGTGVFTNLSAVDIDFDAASALLYDPLTLELGAQVALSPAWRLYLQLDYEAWSKFEAPAIDLGNSTGLTLSTGHNPSFRTRDLWIPRIGSEWDLGGWLLRAGYAYRASIFTDLPTEAGNYLDPPKHMFQLGAGFKFLRFLGLPAPHELDLHLAWHQLVSQQVTKSAGNEAGTAGDQKIGAPGYEAGGKILGGGVSLSFAF